MRLAARVHIMSRSSILLVDDETVILSILSTHLQNQGYSVDVAATQDTAETLLAERQYGAVVVDLTPPGSAALDGCGLLNIARQQNPEAVRILFSAHVAPRKWPVGCAEDADVVFLTRPPLQEALPRHRAIDASSVMSRGTLIQEILTPGALTVMLQPIFKLGDELQVHAFECLVRGPAIGNNASSEMLFEYVRREQVEHEIDLLCCELGLSVAARVPGSPSISLNVHASSVEKDRDFPEKIAKLSEDRGIAPSRLIIEFLEHASNGLTAALSDGISRLRGLGMKVALDDVGSWQSNFKMMLDCQPDYMKIDRHFVHGSHSDMYRRAILSSISHLAGHVGAQVVAEGLEDPADLVVLNDLGIQLAQGYLLARPMTSEHLLAGFADRRHIPGTHH